MIDLTKNPQNMSLLERRVKFLVEKEDAITLYVKGKEYAGQAQDIEAAQLFLYAANIFAKWAEQEPAEKVWLTNLSACYEKLIVESTVLYKKQPECLKALKLLSPSHYAGYKIETDQKRKQLEEK